MKHNEKEDKNIQSQLNTCRLHYSDNLYQQLHYQWSTRARIADSPYYQGACWSCFQLSSPSSTPGIRTDRPGIAH